MIAVLPEGAEIVIRKEDEASSEGICAEREGLKKRYLGRVDPETGEIISTAGKRGRPKKTDSTQNTPPYGNGKDYQVLYKNFSAALRKTENGKRN